MNQTFKDKVAQNNKEKSEMTQGTTWLVKLIV